MNIYKDWWILWMAVAVAGGIAAGVGDASLITDTEDFALEEPLTSETEPTEEAAQEEAPVEEAAAEDASVSQENADGKAVEYINILAFSKSGLIEQLEFEGFSNEEATLAVESLDVDWNEQAGKKAQEYLDVMSFSRSELVDQLEFDGFTPEQAEYGVDQTGL
ncbi:Ltp family lipoprotein [Halobacillus sp. ACCC02827]|uniref:Ltp family lipoprotein n=1 Tax=Bacillaceae TaxID=186817 RepID=UPI0002A51062|nr:MULTISPECIES: Ltp family lipoprotein [Bacillaceae]ELK47383.1 hypothetical protein D479_06808 [Halobacillus sp. BAB-2008]QHT48537.1 hypothetical protein M662_19285 [Bacillus sp. SB49]WJE15771.1 Ltp family lipoprotein [Halobacillus sp. ACCC02827]